MFPYWSLSSLMALEEDRQRQLERLCWQHRTAREAGPARLPSRQFFGRSALWAGLLGRGRKHSLAAAWQAR